MNKKIFHLKKMISKIKQCLQINCTRCGNNPAEVSHTCPFSVEIAGDDERLCDCCNECTNECAMDI